MPACPSLQRIGDLINASLQPPCITGRVANKAGTQEPDCTVVSHTSNGLGGYSGGSGVEVKRWLLTLEGSVPATLDWDIDRGP